MTDVLEQRFHIPPASAFSSQRTYIRPVWSLYGSTRRRSDRLAGELRAPRTAGGAEIAPKTMKPSADCVGVRVALGKDPMVRGWDRVVHEWVATLPTQLMRGMTERLVTVT
jgi:hypothetical protein